MRLTSCFEQKITFYVLLQEGGLRFTCLVLLEYVVESWLCVAALSPAVGRPSPDFGRGDTERSDVGERARMARFPIFHTTNSIRSSYGLRFKELTYLEDTL